MKILYIITKSNWGGAQRHVYDLAVAMKEKGHTVAVALGGNGMLRKRLEDNGIKTHAIASLGRDMKVTDDAVSMKQLFSIIRRERPNILHLHSPKAAGLGAVIGRILCIRSIVYTVHGWTFNEDRSIIQKALIVFFSWLTVVLTHKTILLSEREYAQTLRFPWVKDKLSLIPLGMKQPLFMSIDGARQMIGKTVGMGLAELGKRTLIGTIAELHPNKGLTYLITAMEQVVREHENVLSIIISDGDLKERLQTMIKDLKLEQYIKLTGYVDQVSEYLKAFNIFVLPSVKEGLPYTLLEAGFASLPVVATTVGGIPEIIEDMKSGVLVQPKNSRELAHAISFMIDHQVMRRQYGSALRESVAKKFSFDKMVREIEDLYNKKVKA